MSQSQSPRLVAMGLNPPHAEKALSENDMIQDRHLAWPIIGLPSLLRPTRRLPPHCWPDQPPSMMGGISGAGGYTIRDILLAEVPAVLRVDFLATAAIIGAIVLVVARRLKAPAHTSDPAGEP
jgi:hypothetical protein